MGGPVRSVRLRVIGGTVELRDDVPRTRAECPTTRPCPHIKCEYHLWIIEGRDRPGRRHPNERPRQSTLRPVWLEWPLPPSCGWDAIETAAREGWTLEQMAKVLGVQISGFRYLLAKALRKLKDRGVSLRDFADGDEDTPDRMGAS